MKSKLTLGLGLLTFSLCLPVCAQGTGFTYQGRLSDNGSPASGNYELQFYLRDAAAAGVPVGPTNTVPVAVSNGLFAVTLDFGDGIFTGPARWLEIGVRYNGSVAAYTVLTPRLQLTPTPYAITAGNFSGNGAGVSNVNAVTLDGLASSNFWQTGGNAGTTAGTHFIGTTDDQPLELQVNSQRALRLESGVTGQVNVIGGWAGNSVALGVGGATIAGGGGIAGGNRVETGFGTLSGGLNNTIQSHAWFATIGGGKGNTIQPDANGATIGGGLSNVLRGGAGTIAGGAANSTGLESGEAAIGGGFQNTIGDEASAGTIAGGYINTIQEGAEQCSIGGGSFNTIGAGSFQVALGGGYLNNVGTNSSYGALAGGWQNRIGATSLHGTIAGGAGNRVGDNSASSTVSGGWENKTGNFSDGSALGGGRYNLTASNSICATVPGGLNNFATNYALAAGRNAKANHTGAFVWGDSSDADIVSTNDNSVTMRASGGYRLFSDSTAMTGVFLEAGSGSWASMSDRNSKENFALVDSQTVLAKVASLPISTWNYKSQDVSVRHIGPMAQDFKAAFGMGESSTGISTVDADGVALAAIQGLNEKVEAGGQRSEVRIQTLETENADLRQRLEKLERFMNQKNGGAQ